MSLFIASFRVPLSWVLGLLSDWFSSWNHQQASPPPPLICPCLSQWDSGHLLALWKARPSVPPPTETTGSNPIQPRKWFYALHTCEELLKSAGREQGGWRCSDKHHRPQIFLNTSHLMKTRLFFIHLHLTTLTTSYPPTAFHSLPPTIFYHQLFSFLFSSCCYAHDKII